MVYKDVGKLDDLCIKMDGLAGLSLVIVDSVAECSNLADSHKDAINLFSNLLFEFKDEFNAVTQEIFSKLDKKTE